MLTCKKINDNNCPQTCPGLTSVIKPFWDEFLAIGSHFPVMLLEYKDSHCHEILQKVKLKPFLLKILSGVLSSSGRNAGGSSSWPPTSANKFEKKKILK